MDDGARELERFKAQLQAELKRFEADLASKHAHWEETTLRERETWLHELRFLQLSFKALVDFALVTMRGLVLVNGGAIVGIITFTSSLWARGVASATATAGAVVPALASFVAGLTFALLTSGLAFVAQAVFTEMKRPQPAIRVGNAIRAVAMVLAVASLFAFVGGAYASIAAFRGPAGP